LLGCAGFVPGDARLFFGLIVLVAPGLTLLYLVWGTVRVDIIELVGLSLILSLVLAAMSCFVLYVLGIQIRPRSLSTVFFLYEADAAVWFAMLETRSYPERAARQGAGQQLSRLARRVGPAVGGVLGVALIAIVVVVAHDASKPAAQPYVSMAFVPGRLIVAREGGGDVARSDVEIHFSGLNREAYHLAAAIDSRALSSGARLAAGRSPIVQAVVTVPLPAGLRGCVHRLVVELEAGPTHVASVDAYFRVPGCGQK
jgi:hypothetical protein